MPNITFASRAKSLVMIGANIDANNDTSSSSQKVVAIDNCLSSGNCY
jgi:hypothetical protein